MSRSRKSPRALLDAWHAQGAERLDPVRFHFIDALERRAASHAGEARRLLDNRLSQLLTAYASDLKANAFAGNDATAVPASGPPPNGILAALVDEITCRADSRESIPLADDAATPASSLPQLAALGDFRKIWASVRTESQLRQSLEQVPENAGPLNSGSLVHRALMLMRELSPGYLQHFLSYVDAVSWAEQLHGGGAATGKDSARAASSKRTRRKPRAAS